jgi:very-short-patch-repair endonuclease
VLWRQLRNRRLNGWKFRRQHPVGPYIVDFVCPAAGLVIEVDGGQHAKQRAHDRVRTEHLNAAGYRVLRFWNNAVSDNLDGVLTRISQAIEGQLTPDSDNARASDV